VFKIWFWYGPKSVSKGLYQELTDNLGLQAVTSVEAQNFASLHAKFGLFTSSGNWQRQRQSFNRPDRFSQTVRSSFAR